MAKLSMMRPNNKCILNVKKFSFYFQIQKYLILLMMPKFMSTNPTHGKVYLIQHYVIKKFDSDLQQVGGFLRVLQSPPPIKLTTNDLIEI